jgi:radical SAM protein with 4Fe4S-binding SPASM domain
MSGTALGTDATGRSGYIPDTCVWEVTLQCTMRCLHCGSGAGMRRTHELDLRECLKVADELHQLGCRNVTLIGGELFLYDGWEHLARHLNDCGIMVTIITNGWLMGAAQIAQIRHAGLTNVGISLDGLEEHHNTIRGNGGSFRRILQAFHRLNREQLSINVVTTVTALNIGDLRPLHALLMDHGVASWQIQIATGMGRLCAHPALILRPEQVRDITEFFREMSFSAKLIMVAGDDIGYYDENERHLRNTPGHWGEWRGCQAGLSVIGIDSVGNIRGCQSMYDERFIEGNVRREPLATIWQRENGFAYNRNFDVSLLEGICVACDMAARCRGGCRGMNHFSTGSVFHNAYCSRSPQPERAIDQG